MERNEKQKRRNERQEEKLGKSIWFKGISTSWWLFNANPIYTYDLVCRDFFFKWARAHSFAHCKKKDNWPHVAIWEPLCLAYKTSGTTERERERKKTDTLPPQFKIKCNLEREELQELRKQIFWKWVYRPSMKTPHARERLIVRSTEDILGCRESDWVKILFFLWENVTERRCYFF